MDMNHVQRLILSNQYDIMARLDPAQADHYQRCKTIVERGYCLQLLELEKDFGLLHKQVCEEVIATLEMYHALQVSYDNLPAESQQELAPNRIQYIGYSRTSERQLADYVDFLLDTEKRVADLGLQNKALDAQNTMQGKYQRMLAIWQQCPRQYKLSLPEIRNILAA